MSSGTPGTVAPPVLRAPNLAAVPGLVHGFCGREGGVSSGPFASLNVSTRVGDDRAAVLENWRRVRAAAAPLGRFATMHQVHGTRVARVTPDRPDAGAADALVTDAAGVALPVLTADCVPVLIVAPARRVVAAVHAGWRGAAAGILAATLDVLAREYGMRGRDLVVALGPAIDGCCYEVGAEVARALAAAAGPDAAGADWVRRAAGDRVQVDLRRYLAGQLRAAGVDPEQVARVGPCTRCAGAGYFSHRGSGGRTGRQVSFVGWASL